MRTRHENTVYIEGGEALRRKLWGKDYRERDERSKYLQDLIAKQSEDPRAGVEQGPR